MSAEAEWDYLMKLAAQLSAPLRRRFMGAIRDLQGSVPLAQIVRWLENGQIEKIIEAYTSGAQKATLFRIAAQESAVTAATAAASSLAQRLLFTFNPHNPNAVAAIWDHGSKLIQQVTVDVREGVKLLVADGVQQGVNPRATARFIRDGIGLTTRQLSAVTNFRGYLESGDPVALQRALRDKRFDSTVRSSLAGKTNLTKEQIDKMVEAYFRRSVNYRAEAIARTESINALSLGQRLSWEQLFETGKVSENGVRRYWHVARDERTCEICAPIPGMNREGVAWREMFQTPDGPRMGPTVHPHCRCVVFTKPT